MAELESLRATIERHGLWARRSLGQHFLLDANLTQRIAREAGPLDGHTVIEVGPGPGGLTRALLASDAGSVVAVERDPRCLAALAELARAYPGRLVVHDRDARGLDPADLGPAPRRIVANLPYNAGTELLVGWLKGLSARPGSLAGMTLMFQREVADRLAAAPGSKTYGRLSVFAQWLCEVRPGFTVPPDAFTPPPKVWSRIVHLTPREVPLARADPAALERVTGAVFGQRRKMLRQSLKALGDPAALAHAAGVPETARPEQLGVAAFCALARALDGRG